ncbi:MAG: hypothetical protein NZ988_03435 [Thaumarchaeota archaeon]|nr:hypothetical protein [Candidatus Calditenuaceae archaeon]MDW8187085.1 hypothetical protein [Nitrososphaerota archaeon]
MRISSLLGKKVLITGEAGSGKSTRLLELLKDAINMELVGHITIIDMAPKRAGWFGGKLKELDPSVNELRYLTSEDILGPRLSGRSAEEVAAIAKRNAGLIEPLLMAYLKAPTPLLFVNDVTIYLHTGDLELLKSAIAASQTFVGTAYEGVKLSEDRGSGLTKIERERLEILKSWVDAVIAL